MDAILRTERRRLFAMKKILNAGCGKNLSIGTDFIDYYPQDKRVIACNLDMDRIPFDDEVFDEVYSKCVFEHLTNPNNFMSQSFRVLKKGGQLTIITDNANFLGWWFSSHQYKSTFGDDDFHFSLYTDAHLKNWAKKFGFAVEAVAYEPLYGEIFFRRIVKKFIFKILPEKISCARISMVARKV